MTSHPTGADPWRDAFRTELLSHGLSPGRAAGALAEVDEYCADADLTPQEAFGTPAGYARAYAHDFADLPVDRPAPVSWRAGVRALPALGGISLLLGGVDAVSHGVAGAVTVGQVVSVLVCGLATAVFVGLAQRGVAHLPWWLAAVVALGLTGAAYPQLRWTQPLLRPPGWLLLGTGVLLLTVAWWLVGDRFTSARPAAGTETDPGTPGAAVPEVGLRAARLVARWGVPVTLVVAVVLVALLPDGR